MGINVEGNWLRPQNLKTLIKIGLLSRFFFQETLEYVATIKPLL
jgi:hypothetical protein